MDLFTPRQLTTISDQKSDYLYSQLLELSYQTANNWYLDSKIEEMVNQICKELKKRKWFIAELASRYKENNDEWDRIDDMWLKDDRQSSLSQEMTKIWFVLNKLWFDVEWKPLKSEKLKKKFVKRFEIQLSLLD